MNRLRKNFSLISPDLTLFRDRLEVIYGNSGPGYLLGLFQRSRNYRELIRRYSNDSML